MSKPGLILIIEDDTHLNHLLGRSLRRAGFTVEQAFTAEQASFMLQANDYRVVLADMNLGTTRVTTVLKPFRARFQAARTVLIALTGDISFGMMNPNDQYAHGFDFFLSKPVSPPQIVQMVERFVTRSSTHVMASIYDRISS